MRSASWNGWIIKGGRKTNPRLLLEVIDLKEHPELASSEQIIAIPTLIRKLPAPIRVLVGDLSDTEKVLVGLNIKNV